LPFRKKGKKCTDATPFVEFLLEALRSAIEEAVSSDQVTDQVTDQVILLLKSISGKELGSHKDDVVTHGMEFWRCYINGEPGGKRRINCRVSSLNPTYTAYL
jgi:hypothetical protein